MINKRTILSIILIAVIAVPAISALYVDEAEASTDYLEMDTSSLIVGQFDTRNAGNIEITIINNTDDEVSVKVWLTYQNETRVLKETTIEIPAEDEGVAVLNIKFENEGTKNLTIWAESDDAVFNSDGAQKVGHNFALGVSQSIWSNITTYVAIILVVVIIAVAVFLKYRSAPKAEPGITFTELEEQRRSQRKGVESSRSGPRTPTAERRRYEGGRRRNR